MNGNEILQITGTIEGIIYKNEENFYTVVDVDVKDEIITATGIMPNIEEGMNIKLFGYYKSHPTYGMQFVVKTFQQTVPTSQNGILKYLSSGAIKGIGKATATTLVKNFGSNTLEVLENEPERVALLKGISTEKAESFSKQLRENFGTRELMQYLSGFDIPPYTAVNIYKKFGPKSIDKIRENPYSLCDNGLRVTFEVADMIANHQGKSVDNSCRVKAGITHILNHNLLNGHTCLPKDKLLKTASGFLGVEEETAKTALFEMEFDTSLKIETFEEQDYVFLPDMHRGEIFIANRIKLMEKFPPQSIKNSDEIIEKIQKEEGITYAEKQKTAIKSAIEKGILILTGGPGTGKTTTLNAIIKIFETNGQKVILTAPTGRAAQRMSQVTGKEAKTIHRLLEVAFDNDDRQVFRKNEKNLLKCDVLIVDEVSMVDSLLFASLLEAIPFGAKLILVGDSNQLPSVGAGNVLSNLISSHKLPYVELTEIFRQSMKSLIVTNAHKIVEGELPDISRHDNDFFFLPTKNSLETTELVLDLFSRRLVNTYGYSPMEDIQILCPGRKGSLGSNDLNEKIQEAINPPDKEKQEIKFTRKVLRVGDKVMQYKNNYDIVYTKDNGEVSAGIFNGDIGTITEISRKNQTIKVRFEDKTAVYDFDSAQDIELSYATTIHKSQGNEFEAVIIPLMGTPHQLCYRNLLYTGVTRAKKLLIIVGDSSILAKMTNNNKQTKRYSGLKYFLKRDDTL